MRQLVLLWAVLCVGAVRRVIIDQDSTGPGTTNTVSIAALLSSPEIYIEGITVASGDGYVGEETLHALRLLELLNRTDIPVYAGSPGPILPRLRREVQLRGSVSGRASWLGAWASEQQDPYAVNASSFPEGLPTARAVPGVTASEFIAETLRGAPGQISILALAPMSNIAGAMVLEPSLPRLAKELVFMGGAVACGKTTLGAHCDAGPLYHEFNTWYDPEAARKVLRTVPYVSGNWSKIVALPADVASQPSWSVALQSRIEALTGSCAAADYVLKYLIRDKLRVTFPLFDELTAVFWAECKSSEASGCQMIGGAQQLDIDVSPEESSRGLLQSWAPGAGPGFGEQQATVYLGQVDLAAFETQLLSRLCPKS